MTEKLGPEDLEADMAALVGLAKCHADLSLLALSRLNPTLLDETILSAERVARHLRLTRFIQALNKIRFWRDGLDELEALRQLARSARADMEAVQVYTEGELMWWRDFFDRLETASPEELPPRWGIVVLALDSLRNRQVPKSSFSG